MSTTDPVVADREYDVVRRCAAEGIDIRTISYNAEWRLKHAIELLANGEYTETGTGLLHQVLADVQKIEPGICPWVGRVTVQVSNGLGCWQCPMCRTPHEESS